jgi:hypothetical protein
MADKTEVRADRLKAALRENLKRRKAQARGRDGARDRTREGPEDPCDPGQKRED